MRGPRAFQLADQDGRPDHSGRPSSAGEASAWCLFSNQLIDQAQHHCRLGHLDLGYTTWGQA
ncbi:hypothetical protein DCW30_24900 [Streptomyces alfalfae]|uniref:Uncharacterized protein n=1 Tax=Streptomyces alfalfae TaxID=1642299 RepID=A0ABN4VI30_9ACTN|nr:hypothetical protein A7J05_06915 [Streptomyces alfalfae]AYA15837.1 hypothetical protein D3X13_05965 [Streptomyces fradiae]RXX39313.1 hypothetical protein DCW30_24900 [Streptomyces alfalfae]RZM96228.1 hypothetical protein D4104_15405 [Streptomyces alfalfae]